MFTHITKTARFTNSQWFDMMTNNIHDMSISVMYITRIYKFTSI